MKKVKKVSSKVGVMLIVLAPVLGACGGGSAANAAPHSTLVYEVAIAFTGPDASFGPETDAGCVPAAYLINADGGVLGHKFKCLTTNTEGDPADAVPAVEKMLATVSNIVGILGPSSDEASAVVPIINASHIPMFPVTGQPSFNTSNYSYFWRTLPADNQLGYAMAAWGKQEGYSQASALFLNDVGGQAQVPALASGYSHFGLKLTPNLAVAPDQSSYRTEIEQILATHPSAIFSETDPQTGATFMSELRSLTSSSIPIVGDDVTLETPWLTAVGNAIGATNLENSCVAVQPYSPAQGAGWQAYEQALLASASQISGTPAKDHTTDPYSMDPYDGAIIMALAMLQANSVNPAVFNSHILDVTQPGRGAVVVHTFAQGKAELAGGHQIQYIGAMGPVDFNQYHNSTGAFEVVRCGINQSQPIAILSVSQIAAAEG